MCVCIYIYIERETETETQTQRERQREYMQSPTKERRGCHGLVVRTWGGGWRGHVSDSLQSPVGFVPLAAREQGVGQWEGLNRTADESRLVTSQDPV